MSSAPNSRGRQKVVAPLRKAGPQSNSPVGSLPREDYIVLMPAAEFEAWCARRLAAVAGQPELERETLAAVEADRKLRRERLEEGKLIAAEQRAQLTRPALSESPLELKLLNAFFASGAFGPVRASAGPLIGWGKVGALFHQLPIQAGDARYRLDFAVVNISRDVFLAVEVDGRDFHDRTAQQAQRDRQRDRALVAAGWVVVRFSGSEVHRDARECVTDVVDTVLRSRRSRGEASR